VRAGFRPAAPRSCRAVEGTRPPVRESIEFARIVAFTDGVFAIAITVLVLGIDVPEELPDADLRDFLVDSWPQLFAYFLSFAVIGRFWLSHHRVFETLHDFDRRLLVLNLVYLSLIVLIPFPTNLLGEYGSEPEAVVLYAFVIGSASLLSWLLLRSALHGGHVAPALRSSATDMAGGSLAAALVFYASMPIAVVSSAAGQLFWLALVLDGLRRRR
jgi:uncharacterized membrane protein